MDINITHAVVKPATIKRAEVSRLTVGYIKTAALGGQVYNARYTPYVTSANVEQAHTQVTRAQIKEKTAN